LKPCALCYVKTGLAINFVNSGTLNLLLWQSPVFPRRNFITTVTAGAATVANLAPLKGFANIIPPEQELSPDRPIRIISTDQLSAVEQEKIRSVSKNIDLQIEADPKSPAFEEAEVIIGNADASILLRAKKLKWVQLLHAGVENMPKK
jgi:hypothetical protein